MRPSSSSRTTYAAIIAVVILLFLLHYRGYSMGVEGFFRSLMMRPMSYLRSWNIGASDSWRYFKDREHFINEFQSCRDQAVQVSLNRAELDLLKQENEELRKLLGFQRSQTRQIIVANVVGKDVNSANQIIIIDRGSEHNIISGDPVIAAGGVLVGKVLKVESRSAMVRLLNDSQSQVAATVLNHERSLGIVEGGFGISLRLKLIPRDELVLVADQIVASGLESAIPRGLLIGTVAVIENEPYKPFQQAILSPTINLQRLTVVGVLKTN